MIPPRAIAGRKIYLIATEESGDRLGASLMKVLRQRLGDAVRFEGVGGRAMAREGLASLFPIERIVDHGLYRRRPRNLPMILRRIRDDRRCGDRRHDPDVLVIIDSPDFTHRVAKRVRARDASIPIVDYVSPTVWAWRPGRARAMRPISITCWRCCRSSPRHTASFGGPPCTYVGHPLIEQIGQLRPNADEQQRAGRAAAGAAGAAGQPPQ